MTRERRLIAECRTALKIAEGSLLGINDVVPMPRVVDTANEMRAVVDKIDAYYQSAQETRTDDTAKRAERLDAAAATGNVGHYTATVEAMIAEDESAGNRGESL